MNSVKTDCEKTNLLDETTKRIIFNGKLLTHYVFEIIVTKDNKIFCFADLLKFKLERIFHFLLIGITLVRKAIFGKK